VTQTLSRSRLVELPSSHETITDIPGCRPLDVLIVASEAPPIISGISTCIERLATGLTQRGHRIRVLSSTQIPRVTVGEYRLSSFLAFWPRIARELRHFDVVNVHGPVPTMSDAFLRLSSLLPPHARPAIVYTHHSPIDIRSATRMSARYNKLHESLALRADRIVTSSQYYATQHRSRYGPLVRAIPWGVDARVSSQTFVPRSAEKLRVLFVGQMRPYKGVETLLAAVAGQPWLELTLVGKGTELANYQRLADRLSVTNATFTGRLSDAELNRQYCSNDVVVLPSVTRAEAFGLVLLEGMAAGCVPVASDLPGVRDVAGPTGVVVPPRDPKALRQALRELADDEARLKHLQVESWLAAQTRTWERCVTSYEEVLLDAARCRYARVNGFAVLPEVDEEECRQAIGDPYAVPEVENDPYAVTEVEMGVG
jgi:glycosyltransferase involved in cell wall biosynthesis